MPRNHEKEHPLLSVSLWNVEILFDIGIRAGQQKTGGTPPAFCHQISTLPVSPFLPTQKALFSSIFT